MKALWLESFHLGPQIYCSGLDQTELRHITEYVWEQLKRERIDLRSTGAENL